MLKPKIRAFAADRFPFTTEGYEKAKNILKSKYGKDSGVANAHIQGLISLLRVNNSSPQKINEFYKNLYTHMQVLDTMGKLREIKDYVRLTLDRLPGIKSNLVKLKADDKWDDWDFEVLTKELSKWIDCNPVWLDPKTDRKKEQLVHVSQRDSKTKVWVYCSSKGHKSNECEKVRELQECRKIHRKKKSCFNCTGMQHRTSSAYTSKRTCQMCRRKHPYINWWQI